MVSYRRIRRQVEADERNKRLTAAWIAKNGLTPKQPEDRLAATNRRIIEDQADAPELPKNGREAIDYLDKIASGATAPPTGRTTSTMGHMDEAVGLAAGAQQAINLPAIMQAATDLGIVEQHLVAIGGGIAETLAPYVNQLRQQLAESQQLMLTLSQKIDDAKAALSRTEF
jgi:hypothetical protein